MKVRDVELVSLLDASVTALMKPLRRLLRRSLDGSLGKLWSIQRSEMLRLFLLGLDVVIGSADSRPTTSPWLAALISALIRERKTRPILIDRRVLTHPNASDHSTYQQPTQIKQTIKNSTTSIMASSTTSTANNMSAAQQRNVPASCRCQTPATPLQHLVPVAVAAQYERAQQDNFAMVLEANLRWLLISEQARVPKCLRQEAWERE